MEQLTPIQAVMPFQKSTHFVLPETPEPIELQLPFLFAAAYLPYAILLVEERILKLEGIRKGISGEGAAELRLCHIQNGALRRGRDRKLRWTTRSSSVSRYARQWYFPGTDWPTEERPRALSHPLLTP
jgi:hypothetical protein